MIFIDPNVQFNYQIKFRQKPLPMMTMGMGWPYSVEMKMDTLPYENGFLRHKKQIKPQKSKPMFKNLTLFGTGLSDQTLKIIMKNRIFF